MSNDLPKHALSVRQPWAWAIIYAGKHLENRSPGAIKYMSRDVRRLAIHASKGMTRDEYEDMIDHPGLRMPEAKGALLPRPEALIRGAIIGYVDVIDRVSESRSPWWCGPRALVLANPVAIDPIPSVGALGYFEWKPGGELDPPKPWMTAWPENTLRAARVKAVMPTTQDGLFDDCPDKKAEA